MSSVYIHYQPFCVYIGSHSMVRDVPRRLQIWAKSQGVCWYCGDQLPYDSMHMDHFVPRKDGGKDSQDNLVPSCSHCNRAKSGTPLEVWRQRLLSRTKASQIVFWFETRIPALSLALLWRNKPSRRYRHRLKRPWLARPRPTLSRDEQAARAEHIRRLTFAELGP